MKDLYNLKLVTAPAVEPVTRSDLTTNDFLRGVDFTLPSEQSLFDNTLIPTARRLAETWLGRRIITQTWDITYDYSVHMIQFPFGQLSSITSVKVISDNETETTQSSSLYSFSTGDSGKLFLTNGSIWSTTTRAYDSFVVQFVCGWASAAVVPDCIKHGINVTITHMYDNREGVNELPELAQQIMSGERILKVGI